MSAPDGDDQAVDPLLRGVRLHTERLRLWRQDEDRSVAARLAQIGVLGWMIVVPTLIGIFAGRWLDRHFHSVLFWTAPMMMLGAVLGCWSAWKWMQDA